MYNTTPQRLLSVLLSLTGLGMFATAPSLAEELRSTAVVAHPAVGEVAHQHMAQTGNTVVDVAAGNDAFSTLVTAVQAAELVEALSGEGPFTVFAPTNDAFAALPTEILEALLLPENQDLLTEVLAYHVIPDTVTSAGLRGPREVETLNGPVRVRSSQGEILVNDANVLLADVEASNGVIHAIDTVLIPEGLVDELTARMAAAEVAEVDTEDTTVVVEEESTVVEEVVVEEVVTPAPTTPATTTPAPTATTEPVQGLW